MGSEGRGVIGRHGVYHLDVTALLAWPAALAAVVALKLAPALLVWAHAVPADGQVSIDRATLWIGLGIYALGQLSKLGMDTWRQYNQEKSKSAIGELEICKRQAERERAEFAAALKFSEEQNQRHLSEVVTANAHIDRLQAGNDRMQKLIDDQRGQLRELTDRLADLGHQLADLGRQTAANNTRIIDHIEARQATPAEPVKVSIQADDEHPVPVRPIDGV
jgi:flagellar motility protein MotE (MotC chaperone)